MRSGASTELVGKTGSLDAATNIVRITGGTGAYAELEGKGTILVAADFTDGRLTITRDGRVEPGDADEDDD